MPISRIGQNHIYIYIWCIYGNFGRKITKYMVMYGVDIRFWPTLPITKNVNETHVSKYSHHLLLQFGTRS